MVSSLVERATSDMLIGPDWAMNIEICDMLNHDLGQAKDVVRGIKRRILSKNPKVQLLALTLLETIVKNCGDIVHMHVAEKDVLHEMVRIARKKPDYHVKEKILILIDTWQEAFGGARARYPQFYSAYQELLRAGAVFPKRTDLSAPVFTPPQTQPLTSYPQNLRNLEHRSDAAGSSAESEFPTLSLTEIQNARGIMDVLAEMLSAIDPGNKQGVGQEVIVDLVDQCRTYKQRVVHLVNSTTDESLLCQGLSLNDDLQRLLAKHEAIASGTSLPPLKLGSETGALVPVDSPLVDTGDSSNPPESAGIVATTNQPAVTNGLTPPAAANPKIDLLSGDLLDGFASPKADNSLALVPVNAPQPGSPASQQKSLVLFDMFSDINGGPSAGQPSNSTSQIPQQASLQSPGMGFSQYEQPLYAQGPSPAWNGQQLITQQQPGSPGYGAFPPPPWEAQPQDLSPTSGGQYSPTMQVTTQVVVTHTQPVHTGLYPQGPQPGNLVGMYIQPITGNAVNNQALAAHPSQMQGGYQPQPNSMYPQQMYGNQMPGYGYGQQQGSPFGQQHGSPYGQQQGSPYGQQQGSPSPYLDQQMYGMSIRDDSVLRNSSNQVSDQSYLPPMRKVNKAEDKLFGDLVDIAKFKPTKPTPGRAGSM